MVDQDQTANEFSALWKYQRPKSLFTNAARSPYITPEMKPRQIEIPPLPMYTKEDPHSRSNRPLFDHNHQPTPVHTLKTPARIITSWNCSRVTPELSPAPPFASRIISLSKLSSIESSFNSRAIRRKWLNEIGPFEPRVNNWYAVSTSAARASSS